MPSSSNEESETESLSNSTMEYPFFWDRRYHKYHEGSYLYPNDEPESERQDCEFAILQKFLFSKQLFFAPIIENPKEILDIGTGTGLWAVEMARQFPGARIKAWDLSPIQPDNAPPNVTWELFDCTENTWFRRPSCLDYIHVSMMFGALPRYEELIRKAKEYLVPGTGWIEFRELLPEVFSDDNSIPERWAFGRWLELYRHFSSQMIQPARPVMIADKIKQWLERAGYVDVHEFVNNIPISPWPEKVRLQNMGKIWKQNLENAMPGWSYKTIGDGYGTQRNEIEVLLAAARADLRNPDVHGYQKVYCVYGRRPTSAEARALQERGQKGAQTRNSVHPAPGARFPASQHGNARAAEAAPTAR